MGCVLVELMKNIIQGKCNEFDNLALKTRRYTSVYSCVEVSVTKI